MIAPPPAAPLTLSSRDVARLLGVGEATVKRWADEGVLKCRKTVGGHRRFTLSGVAAMRAKRVNAGGEWPATPDDAHNALFRAALAGDGDGLTRLALAGIDDGLSVESLCDDWISPMLSRVGEGWESGEIAIAQEHIASGAVGELISQLAPLLVREPVRGVALTGCLPSEQHELGARMAGLVLRLAHYRVIHVGANAPLSDLMAEAERERVSVLALSGQTNQPGVDDALRRLRDWAIRRRAHVFVGGLGFGTASMPDGIRCLDSFAALKTALREL